MFNYSIEQYIERQTLKWKKKQSKYIDKLKSQGKKYYTKDRLKGIEFNKYLATT
jgi:hypothetical protein